MRALIFEWNGEPSAVLTLQELHAGENRRVHTLSFRDVEDLLADRGIIVSYETTALGEPLRNDDRGEPAQTPASNSVGGRDENS